MQFITAYSKGCEHVQGLGYVVTYFLLVGYIQPAVMRIMIIGNGYWGFTVYID